jgi:hypothetical protein
MVGTAYKYVTSIPSCLGLKSMVYVKMWGKSSNRKVFTSLCYGDRLGTYRVLCHCWLSCLTTPYSKFGSLYAASLSLFTWYSRSWNNLRMSNLCHRTHESRKFWCNMKANSVSLLRVFHIEWHHLIKQVTFVLIRYLSATGNFSECFLRIAKNNEVNLHKQTLCTQSVCLQLSLAWLSFHALICR